MSNMGHEARSYENFVRHQAERNPCLLPLVGLLEQSKSKEVQPSSIYCIDCEIHSGALSNAKKSSLEDVVADIEGIKSSSGSASSLNPLGRIIFVENLGTHALRSFGACLDIDPLFFANYLFTEYTHIECEPAPPSLALLPSKLTDRDCIHLHYNDVLALSFSSLESGKSHKFTSIGNVQRSLRRPQALPGFQPGILGGCCSAVLKRFKGGSWICQ